MILALAWLAGSAFATDLARLFPAGSGSRFLLHADTAGDAELVISIAAAETARLSVEYYVSSRAAGIPVELWQQFVLSSPVAGAPKIEEGYFFAKELTAPEKLTGEYLRGLDGLVTADFLFPSKQALDKFKVGEESVTVPAGTVKAIHYRQPPIDYWISDDAKPIGLVKLVSSGDKPKNRYRLELESIVRNVKPKIDPARAVPLSEKGRALLAPGAEGP